MQGLERVGTQSLERVGFIGGAGHSGSTLLGLMLGAHPRVFYAGEAKKSLFLGDATKPLKKRVCKLCGETCPVWSRVRPGGDLYAELAAMTGRPIVIDSTKSLEWIDARLAALEASAIPRALFFLGRDGRAVVGSRRRKYPEIPTIEHARAFLAETY